MSPTRRVLTLMMTAFFIAPSARLREPPSHVRVAEGFGWTELMASMDRMDAAMMSVKPSGTTDVDFVRLMLPHHLAALDMARTELLGGHDPQMRRLAQEMIVDQESEIQLMQLWLKQHVGKEP